MYLAPLAAMYSIYSKCLIDIKLAANCTLCCAPGTWVKSSQTNMQPDVGSRAGGTFIYGCHAVPRDSILTSGRWGIGPNMLAVFCARAPLLTNLLFTCLRLPVLSPTCSSAHLLLCPAVLPSSSSFACSPACT